MRGACACCFSGCRATVSVRGCARSRSKLFLFMHDPGTEAEGAGDFLIHAAFTQQSQHLVLAWRQAAQAGSGETDPGVEQCAEYDLTQGKTVPVKTADSMLPSPAFVCADDVWLGPRTILRWQTDQPARCRRQLSGGIVRRLTKASLQPAVAGVVTGFRAGSNCRWVRSRCQFDSLNRARR